MKLFIHRYKISKDGLRKKARKLCKENKITLLEQSTEGFLYDITGYRLVNLTKHSQTLIGEDVCTNTP